MLRVRGRHQAARKRRAWASPMKAARLIAAGMGPAEVARRLGCSRLRVIRLMSQDPRFKAEPAGLPGEPGPQPCPRTRISSRSGAK